MVIMLSLDRDSTPSLTLQEALPMAWTDRQRSYTKDWPTLLLVKSVTTMPYQVGVACHASAIPMQAIWVVDAILATAGAIIRSGLHWPAQPWAPFSFMANTPRLPCLTPAFLL